MMARKKKVDEKHDDHGNFTETFDVSESDETLTSEMIEPEKTVSHDKAKNDFAEHPKFSKFRGEK